MKNYTWEDYKPYVPVWVSLFVAYFLFIVLSYVIIQANNATFYPDGAATYRPTWAHFLLPAVGALFVYLFTEFVEERYGVSLRKNLAYHLGILLAYFVGYPLGIWAFGQTFVYYSGSFLAWGDMWRLFLFLPYWALLPGILGAQLVLLFWAGEGNKSR